MLLVKTPKLKLALKHATVARLLIYTVCKMSNAPLKSTQYLITVYLIESTSFVPLTVSPLNHFKRDHIQSLKRKNEWCILDSFSWALEFAPPLYKKSQTAEVGSSVIKHYPSFFNNVVLTCEKPKNTSNFVSNYCSKRASLASLVALKRTPPSESFKGTMSLQSRIKNIYLVTQFLSR